MLIIWTLVSACQAYVWVRRARDQIASKASPDVAKKLKCLLSSNALKREEQEGKHLQRLIVKSTDKVNLIRTSEVEYIESERNFVVAKVGNENHILQKSIPTLETNLYPSWFLRISRSANVNLDFVKELSVLFKS